MKKFCISILKYGVNTDEVYYPENSITYGYDLKWLLLSLIQYQWDIMIYSNNLSIHWCNF